MIGYRKGFMENRRNLCPKRIPGHQINPFVKWRKQQEAIGDRGAVICVIPEIYPKTKHDLQILFISGANAPFEKYLM